MKAKILYLGHIRCHTFHLFETPDETTFIKSPMWALLIDHPKLGKILLDTGNDPDHLETYSPAMKETYPVPEVISIKEALAEEGLKPSDIDILMISHLHFDHVGGIKFFANTKAGANIIVTEPDAREAFYMSNLTPDGFGGAYIGSLFSKIPGIGYKPIDEDQDLTDDIHLFIQKSHTPGVLGLRLDFKNAGTYILPSDTIYTIKSYEENLPPGGTINKTSKEFHDNRDYIMDMQEKYKATLIFGHDYDQIVDLAAKGWIE